MNAYIVLSILAAFGFAYRSAVFQGKIYRRWRINVSRPGASWLECPIDHTAFGILRAVVQLVLLGVFLLTALVTPSWFVFVHIALLLCCLHPLAFQPVFNHVAGLPTWRMVGETAWTDILIRRLFGDNPRWMNTAMWLLFAAGTFFDLWLVHQHGN